MTTSPTWQPLAAPYDENDNGKLDRRERRALPDTVFAFPVQRELPLVDGEHVQAAVAELAVVRQVTDEERQVAAANIGAAAAYYGVELPAGALAAQGRRPAR